MIIKFNEFGGISPRYNSRQLPMPYAVTADNCKMDRGQLRGFAGATTVFGATTLIASLKSIFIYKPVSTEYLLQWPNLTSVVANANPSDVYKRLYWTEQNSVPQMGAQNDIISGVGAYPYNSYDLGVPSPLGLVTPSRVITVDSPSVEDIDGGIATPFIRSYTYTYVTDYGEESPPFVPAGDAAFLTVTLYEGDEVSLSGMSTVPAGNHPFNPASGAKKRVYQTDINGNFRLVAEIALATTTWQGNHMDYDSSVALNLQILIGAEPLSSMQGLVLSRAGFMVGFDGNTLLASSPSLYHNWPLTNREAVPYKILGLVPMSQGILVITEGAVYVAMGNDPSNISIVDLDTSLGCVSAESIVDMGGYAVYASQNGLVAASSGSATIVTSDVILAADWTNYLPETMKGYRHQHRLILNSDSHKFIVNPKGTSDRLVSSTLPVDAGLVYYSNGYLLYTPDGTTLSQFDSDVDNPIPYKWVSAAYIGSQPAVVSCYKLDADDYDDLTMQVYVDGLPLYAGLGLVLNPLHVDSRNNFLLYGRLPVFPAAFDVVVEFSGSSALNSVTLSDNFGELINE